MSNVIELPIGDHAERVRILREFLQKELPLLLQEQGNKVFRDFVEKFGAKFTEIDLPLPVRMEVSYYYEGDDEGGSNTYIESISLYDADDEYIDSDWHEVIVKKKSWRGDEYYDYQLYDLLIDTLNDLNAEDMDDYGIETFTLEDV